MALNYLHKDKRSYKCLKSLILLEYNIDTKFKIQNGFIDVPQVQENDVSVAFTDPLGDRSKASGSWLDDLNEQKNR